MAPQISASASELGQPELLLSGLLVVIAGGVGLFVLNAFVKAVGVASSVAFAK